MTIVTPTPKNPLDVRLDELIAAATKSAPGFGLGLLNKVADDGLRNMDIIVRPAPAGPKLVYEYLPPSGIRSHIVYTVESLITAVAINCRGQLDYTGGVFVGDDSAIYIIDDSILRGERERFTMPMRKTPEAAAWEGLFGKTTDHRALLRALLPLSSTLQSPTILDSMRSVRATATAAIDSDVRTDGQSSAVVFNVAGDKDLVKFPRSFKITASYYAESDLSEEVTIDVEIILPESPGQKVGFLLTCPGWPNFVIRSRQAVLAKIKAGLAQLAATEGANASKVMVVQGAPMHDDRQVEEGDLRWDAMTMRQTAPPPTEKAPPFIIGREPVVPARDE